MTLARLKECLEEQPRHVSPFLMLGDPTPEISFQLAAAAIEAGASMLELGIPFSDPCADGPAIQEACRRAQQAGTTTRTALDLVARIHRSFPRVPMNLLVYGNLVHAWGCQSFCASAATAGASSLLVPDVILEEGAALRAACKATNLGHVPLLGPLTPPSRIQQLDATCTGFLYLAAHQGITGNAAQTSTFHRELLQRITPQVRHPVCLGFGLSQPEQLTAAFESGAAICVIGSHLARSIESAVLRHGGEIEPIVQAFMHSLLPLLQTAPQPKATQ